MFDHFYLKSHPKRTRLVGESESEPIIITSLNLIWYWWPWFKALKWKLMKLSSFVVSINYLNCNNNNNNRKKSSKNHNIMRKTKNELNERVKRVRQNNVIIVGVECNVIVWIWYCECARALAAALSLLFHVNIALRCNCEHFKLVHAHAQAHQKIPVTRLSVHPSVCVPFILCEYYSEHALTIPSFSLSLSLFMAFSSQIYFAYIVYIKLATTRLFISLMSIFHFRYHIFLFRRFAVTPYLKLLWFFFFILHFGCRLIGLHCTAVKYFDF